MTVPIVSVIIPVYNSERFIKETVESVLHQTYQDFEIIIIDDGSKDNTKKIVENFNEPKIRYIYQENKGVSAARNNGILNARGKYIALLDHDDTWLPEKLEKQIPILEAHSEIALVYSDCDIIDSYGHIIGRAFNHFQAYRGKVFDKLFLCNFIPCLTAVIRKEVLNKIGMFSLTLCIAEEYDLFLRISEISEVDFINSPLAQYREHETNFSKNEVLSNEEIVQVVTDFLKNHPELRNTLGDKVVNKYLSTLYYNLGKAYFFNNDKKRAYYYLDKSINACKYWFRPVLFKLFTFMGSNFLKKLRILKLKI